MMKHLLVPSYINPTGTGLKHDLEDVGRKYRNLMELVRSVSVGYTEEYSGGGIGRISPNGGGFTGLPSPSALEAAAVAVHTAFRKVESMLVPTDHSILDCFDVIERLTALLRLAYTVIDCGIVNNAAPVRRIEAKAEDELKMAKSRKGIGAGGMSEDGKNRVAPVRSEHRKATKTVIVSTDSTLCVVILFFLQPNRCAHAFRLSFRTSLLAILYMRLPN